MHRLNGMLMRQLLAAIVLSAVAIAAMLGVIGSAGAADYSGHMVQAPPPPPGVACPPPVDVVLFYYSDELLYPFREPTVPARTPYIYCQTGAMLVRGDIPPPPEYCCH